MALRGAAARRYAQAAFQIARETNGLDRWLNDLKKINSIFGSPSVASLVQNPRVTDDEKRQVIERLLPAGTVDPLVTNLLMLLARRERLTMLPRIVEVFQELYNREKGIVVADVTTAVPLNDAQQRGVAERLARITGKTVQLHVHHDPRILGGMITRIGDELIDASVSTRLAQLAERLT